MMQQFHPWEDMQREKNNSKIFLHPIFLAALFTIAKTWERSKCLSTKGWIRKLWCIYIYLGFPDSSVGKESTCNAGDPRLGYPLQYSWASLWLSWQRICLQCRKPRFNLWVGKIPWRRKRPPTPIFWPREFHGLYSLWGHKVRLSGFHFHFSVSYIFIYMYICVCVYIYIKKYYSAIKKQGKSCHLWQYG